MTARHPRPRRSLPRPRSRPCIAPSAFAVFVALALALGIGPHVTPAPRAAAAVSDTTLAAFDGGTIEPYEFSVAWERLLPTERPKGDPLESRRVFLLRMVDRKLLAREALRKPLVMTADEQAELERVRRQLVQNDVFEHYVADLPPPTPEELDAFRRQMTRLAKVRFISFTDWNQARLWRQRLATGTPMGALDELIAAGGPETPQADDPRWLAADQIPDTLAQVIWAMRPGQVSEVHSFAGHPVLIHVLDDQARPGAPISGAASNLESEYTRRRFDRIRERLRQQLAEKAQRVFVDEGMNTLLESYLKLPTRSDVDSVTGMPIIRANLPLPSYAPADSGLVLARTRHGEVTLISYLRYWGRIPGYARPEVRDRATLEATVDRLALEDEILALGHTLGLDHSPRIEEELKRMREGFALDHYFEAHIASRVRPTEADLEAYFASRPHHYDDLATLEARIILLDRADLADSILALAKAGRSFEELARTYSMDGSTASKGGKTGLVARGTNPNAGLEDEMFATAIGQIGGPERTPEGWVLWRIEAKSPGKVRTLDEAREWVERDYRTIEGERRLEEHLAGLRKKAHVRTFDDRVTEQLGAGGPWGP